jgi:hypothetical protein
VARGRLGGLASALAIVVGLVATGLGYAVARVRLSGDAAADRDAGSVQADSPRRRLAVLASITTMLGKADP